MGQPAMPAGLKLRNIVFRNQILFLELDHGFQLAVADGRLLILPDVSVDHEVVRSKDVIADTESAVVLVIHLRQLF